MNPMGAEVYVAPYTPSGPSSVPQINPSISWLMASGESRARMYPGARRGPIISRARPKKNTEGWNTAFCQDLYELILATDFIVDIGLCITVVYDITKEKMTTIKYHLGFVAM